MNENPNRLSSLESRGIITNTSINDEILTAISAQNIRFRAMKPNSGAKPIGYSFSEVDKFVKDTVIPSLEWYALTLHNRDKTVYFLGTELEKLEANVNTLTHQLSNSPVPTQQNGDSDDAAAYVALIQERDEYIGKITTQYKTLQNAYKTLEDHDRELSENQEELQNTIQTLQQTIDTPSDGEEGKQIEELREYIQELTKRYEELSALYTQDTTKLAEKIKELQETEPPNQVANDEENKELRKHIAVITNQYQQLETQYLNLEKEYGTSVNHAEVGALKVELESEKAKNLRLETELKTLKQQEEDNEEEEETYMPFLTEQRGQTPATVSKTINTNNLPAGIRLEDL